MLPSSTGSPVKLILTGRCPLFLFHSTLHIHLTPRKPQQFKRPLMIDSPSDLPHFRPLREIEPIKRTNIPISLSGRCPCCVRSSLENSKKLKLGWLEFLESNPEISHPGEVWSRLRSTLIRRLVPQTPPSLSTVLAFCMLWRGRPSIVGVGR